MASQICIIAGCDGLQLARGWCPKHYWTWWRNGDPLSLRHGRDPQERFWQKVNNGTEDTCWPWMGKRKKDGYGVFFLNGSHKTALAHRLSYEWTKGTIPEGLVLDHLCRNTSCVNPSHLEPVTQGINVLRGSGPFAKNAVKTHCIHGHSFDLLNTYVTRNGGRNCRVCLKLRARARRCQV